MSPGEDTLPDASHHALDQLRHDLKTPLVAIHGRAQLLARSVQRSPSLADDERVRMLQGLTGIAISVQEMVTLIDALGDEHRWP